jgi:hypothetical protein
MTDPAPTPPDDSSVQRVPQTPTSARVPERVARGVVATGFLAFFGPTEFVVDFLQFLSRPSNLAARIVMSPVLAERFVQLLREDLARYTAQFGAPPSLPKPPAGDKPKTAQEVYDELKVPEEVLSGVYANGVMVGHTPAEFGIDFMTTFMPQAAVCARIYVAAPRVPQLIETVASLLVQYKRQQNPGAPPTSTPPAPQNRPPASGPEGYGTAPGIPGFPSPPQ